uniref:Chloride channel CLIC-like protein 1 n=1 Tax=Hucho hucho TaxID=62062 RepID=A0A4W5LTU1_9TELE
MSTSAVTMFIIITAAVCSLLLVAQGQMDDEEWIDPYDMLNYDPSTKTMRKPAAVSQLPSCNPVFKQCLTKLLKEIEKFGLVCFGIVSTCVNTNNRCPNALYVKAGAADQ